MKEIDKSIMLNFLQQILRIQYQILIQKDMKRLFQNW